MGQFDELILFIKHMQKKKKKICLAKIDPMFHYSRMIIQFVDFPEIPRKPSMFQHRTEHSS